MVPRLVLNVWEDEIFFYLSLQRDQGPGTPSPVSVVVLSFYDGTHMVGKAGTAVAGGCKIQVSTGYKAKSCFKRTNKRVTRRWLRQ